MFAIWLCCATTRYPGGGQEIKESKEEAEIRGCVSRHNKCTEIRPPRPPSSSALLSSLCRIKAEAHVRPQRGDQSRSRRAQTDDEMKTTADAVRVQRADKEDASRKCDWADVSTDKRTKWRQQLNILHVCALTTRIIWGTNKKSYTFGLRSSRTGSFLRNIWPLSGRNCCFMRQ